MMIRLPILCAVTVPYEHERDDRDQDPRDPFVDGLDLPRGLERELVQDDRERLYELNGEDTLVKYHSTARSCPSRFKTILVDNAVDLGG